MASSNIPADPASLRVGCVGGGQLGRMMALEAPRLNLAMTFLDPSGSNSPAALVVGGQNVLEGKLNDEGKLRELANGCDVLTVEIEHVGVDTLAKLESEGVNVQPSSRVVGIIQDKLTQKVRGQIDRPLNLFIAEDVYACCTDVSLRCCCMTLFLILI